MWEITALGWVRCCSWHTAPATPTGSWVQPAWHPPIPEPPFPGSGTSGLLPPTAPKNHTDPVVLPKTTWIRLCSQKPRGSSNAPKNHMDPVTLPKTTWICLSSQKPRGSGPAPSGSFIASSPGRPGGASPLPPSSPLPAEVSEGAVTLRRAGATPG